MVLHRKQAQFDRARWRKGILVPVWLLQVAMLLSLIGIFAYRLAETAEHYVEDDEKGKAPIVEFVWECTNVAFSVFSLLLTLMEVSKLLSEVLTPFFLFASHVIKMTCAFAILGLDIVVYTKRSEGDWSTVGLAVDCGLLFSMCVLGIYAILRFRRVHEDDDMHHPANAKAFGFGDGYAEIEMGTAGGGSRDSFLPADTEHVSPASGIRARSVSAASSLRRSLSFSGAHSPHTVPTATSDGGRRPSYNHERDTQFDAYVSRAESALSKEEIDLAIDRELWGNTAGDVGRANSVLSVGVVPSRAVPPRPDCAQRAVSWTVVPEEGRAPLLGMGRAGQPHDDDTRRTELRFSTPAP